MAPGKPFSIDTNKPGGKHPDMGVRQKEAQIDHVSPALLIKENRLHARLPEEDQFKNPPSFLKNFHPEDRAGLHAEDESEVPLLECFHIPNGFRQVDAQQIPQPAFPINFGDKCKGSLFPYVGNPLFQSGSEGS